jgi:HD-GYP domain-containing protein (c-di-GMP phosphodiesterase class II)
MDILLENFILTLRRFGDLHSPATEDHATRVCDLAVRIGECLQLSADQLRLLGYGANIHDIGKVFVDSAVLDKAGKLNKAQRAHVEKHPELGYEAIELAELPTDIMLVVLCHQEHYDGSGYPRKLKGEAIPLYARIVTICDVWDALNSDRPYRVAFSSAKALSIMNQCAAWFDPKLFVFFLDIVRGMRA